ncbi:hypothetical protein ACFL0M_06095, partial [Thermodesulfobacteriota bacterium]
MMAILVLDSQIQTCRLQATVSQTRICGIGNQVISTIGIGRSLAAPPSHTTAAYGSVLRGTMLPYKDFYEGAYATLYFSSFRPSIKINVGGISFSC